MLLLRINTDNELFRILNKLITKFAKRKKIKNSFKNVSKMYGVKALVRNKKTF